VEMLYNISFYGRTLGATFYTTASLIDAKSRPYKKVIINC